MIAGGGETGYHLAYALTRRDYRIVLLERDPDRCEHMAKLLPNVTVIHANANRGSILEDEGAGTVDYFVACTGNDESNIMAGVEARELGANRVMCVVGRPDYANVVGKLGHRPGSQRTGCRGSPDPRLLERRGDHQPEPVAQRRDRYL